MSETIQIRAEGEMKVILSVPAPQSYLRLGGEKHLLTLLPQTVLHSSWSQRLEDVENVLLEETEAGALHVFDHNRHLILIRSLNSLGHNET